MFCTEHERIGDWAYSGRITKTRRGGKKGGTTMMWRVKISHRRFLCSWVHSGQSGLFD